MSDAEQRIRELEQEVEDYKAGRKYQRVPGRFPPAPIDMLAEQSLTLAEMTGMKTESPACWSWRTVLRLMRAVEDAARTGPPSLVTSALAVLDLYRTDQAFRDKLA